MEPSKIFGAEECQSSESGWTMYIGSPISDQEDDDDDGHDNDHKKNVYHDDDEYMYDGSDDSMASDASSGPSHLHQQTWEGNGESGHGHAMVLKHRKEDKVKKQVKKKKKKTGFEARKETKEEFLVTQKRGIVTVQSGNKARYIGQRK